NRLDTGKLAGDVEFYSVSPVAAAIPPVPGGVGLMTIAMLMRNTPLAATHQVGGGLPYRVPDRSVLPVSALSQQLSAVMEERFPAVWVEGEVSNFKVYGSGHAYFTLKDESAQLRCVLFRNRARRVRFEPKDGLSVMAFGAVEV